jgi:methylated-DNA-protein-cysteine methyltransferase-like protein
MADEPITREQAATLAAHIYALCVACPAGRVTTYGWIGAALGYPRGARMVGWFMNESHSGVVPAQRVVSAKGELTGSWAFGQKGRMRALLEAEGVTFTDAGTIDMKRYAWDPRTELTPDSLAEILREADAAPLPPVSDYLMGLLRDDAASPLRIQRAE